MLNCSLVCLRRLLLVSLVACGVASCTAERAGFVPEPGTLNCAPGCENGGTCTGTACDCNFTDFDGRTCSDRVDDCIGADCMNGGNCIDESRAFSCECVGTWAPDANTSLCTVSVTTCADGSPCLNAGVCEDVVPGDVDCGCAGTGYMGEFCQNDIDECATNPCMNGGACLNAVGTFSCDCSSVDFNGPVCETKIENCPGVDCRNGGTCKDGVRGFSCNCVGTWAPNSTTGLCTVDVSTCADGDPCMNGGTCVDNAPGDISCNCRSGYSGTFCQNDIDECTDRTATCDPAGTAQCVNQDGSYQCDCKIGFAGRNCDACATGYTGDSCDTCDDGYLESNVTPGGCVADPCVADPCASVGGACSVTDLDSASCDCNNDSMDGTETDLNCGGVDCIQRCGAGLMCLIDDDCESGSCDAGMTLCI